ncbi:MAG: AtpZ/AtpI family protein [Deltaproteobacteria bacterium]|nr:AtpZ/AtpI family protein [Deltaproteobacteria bacterium]
MDNETKKTFRTLSFVSTIGLVMALSVCLGAFIGFFLDKKMETEPWLFFIFLIFGIIAAFKNLFIMLKKLQDKDHQND